MGIPHGLVPPHDDWDALRIASLVSAALSVVGSALIFIQLLSTKLLVTNRRLLVPVSFCIFISHVFILVGYQPSWGEAFCTVEGIIIDFFLLTVIIYTAFIGINTYRSLVMFVPTGSEIYFYHIASFSIPAAIVINGAVSAGYVSDWSSYCSVNSNSVTHVVILGLGIAVVIFDVVMCVLVVFNVHGALRNGAGQTARLSARQRNAIESRLIVLILVTFGLPFVFHAALYVNELVASAHPVVVLFYLDSIFTYSTGFLLCVVILAAHSGARSELWRNLTRMCRRGDGADSDGDGVYEEIE